MFELLLPLVAGLPLVAPEAPSIAQELGTENYRHLGRVVRVEHRADGQVLASSTASGEVQLWEAATGLPLAGTRLESSHAWTIGFLEPERLLVGLREDRALVLERQGDQLAEVDPFELGLGDLVSLGGGTSLGPQGRQLVVWPISGGGGAAMLADLGSGSRIPLEFPGFRAEDVAWSEDGTHLALLLANPLKQLGRQGTQDQDSSRLLLVRAADGEVLHTIHSPGEYLRDLAFGPMEGGSGLLTAIGEAGLHIYDLPAGRELLRFGELEGGTQVDCVDTPAGPVVVAKNADGRLEAWRLSLDDAPVLLLDRQLERPLGALDLAPGGGHLVSAENSTILRWSLPELEPEPRILAHSGTLSALTSVGTRTVSCSFDGTLLVWDEDAATPRSLPRRHVGLVVDASLSPDGQRLLTCGQDGTLRIMSLGDDDFGAELMLRTGRSTAGFSAGAFAPDGQSFAGVTADGVLWIWGGEQGLLERSFEGLKGLQFALAWSADSSRLAVGSTGVRIWDATTWELIRPLGDLGSPVQALAFGADADQLGIGLAGRAVQLRRISDGERLAVWSDLPNRVQDLIWWPQHGLVACARGGQALELLGSTQGQVPVRLALPRGADGLVLGVDGAGRLLSGDSRGFIQAWE